MPISKRGLIGSSGFLAVLTLTLALGGERAFAADRRLMLIGGGPRPKEAIRQMLDWAGGNRRQVLIMTFSSEIPEEVFQGVKGSFTAEGARQVEGALRGPASPAEEVELVKKIARAEVLFFSGGNQMKHMAVLNRPIAPEVLRKALASEWQPRDEMKRVKEILRALPQKDLTFATLVHSRYAAGVPVGGTSAGCAIMSPTMIHEGRTARGLGLLDDNVITDQHFLLRKREERLEGVVTTRKNLPAGIGVDEGGSLAVVNNRFAQVLGPERVMIIDPRRKDPAGKPVRTILHPGDAYDLTERLALTPAHVTKTTPACLRTTMDDVLLLSN